MRLWTIHPKYLDAKGLLASWREGLLAQKVLAGKTKGYRNHPQLDRFKASGRAMGAIATYLADIQAEAARRGYRFDASKIGRGMAPEDHDSTNDGVDMQPRIAVPSGQIEYEFELLKTKLEARDRSRLAELSGVLDMELNAAFRRVRGGTAPWERTIDSVVERMKSDPDRVQEPSE